MATITATTKQLLDKLAWAEVEVEDNPTPANIIQTFHETADGWEVDLYYATNDDNVFVRFYHLDHNDIHIYIHTSDDPYYSPITIFRRYGIYDHQLPDYHRRLSFLNRDRSQD